MCIDPPSFWLHSDVLIATSVPYGFLYIQLFKAWLANALDNLKYYIFLDRPSQLLRHQVGGLGGRRFAQHCGPALIWGGASH